METSDIYTYFNIREVFIKKLSYASDRSLIM